ncbi:MAG: lipase [Lachnospiraceae bacterium]|nr:lipase [Lachnospiraceae bacterium]
MKYVLNDKNVKLLGRTMLVGENLWMAWSATGVEFAFEGKELSITVLGGKAATDYSVNNCFARIGIYVDGIRVTTDLVRQKEKVYEIIKGDVVRKVKVRVIKLSEAPMSTIAIAPIETEGVITPTEKSVHRFEFIGDSITCGYGVDDLDLRNTFSTATEDVTQGYAYLTAGELGADANIISCSGYGVLSGYTDNPAVQNTSELLPPYYEKLGFSRDFFAGDISPQDVDWDFRSYQPELIVLNLGTNDNSFCQEEQSRWEEFMGRYVEFLKVIRRNNPSAQLLCVYGVMEDRIAPSVEKAVESYQKQTGDEKITFLPIQPDDGSRGYAVDYHPAPATHREASQIVVEKIKKLIKFE